MIYLTYNDQPSGIYFSQVTDVCDFVNEAFDIKLKLVALISFRNFFEYRKSIKSNHPNAIVIPMFPKNKNWKYNTHIIKFLFLFIGKQTIWSRGIFATNLALILKEQNWTKKVVFDARGAYEAEFEEYLNKVVKINDSIKTLEANAILNSDFRLAVSSKLLDYWKINYSYKDNEHVVIPCTLDTKNRKDFPSELSIASAKKKFGFENEDIVLVYSGSAADWQSLYLLDTYFLNQFQSNAKLKLLVLSKADITQLDLYKHFNNRIIQKWVNPSEVRSLLFAADYGILIREQAITNQVASPTKFAEYLNAGLNILISEKIGDFTEFTINEDCGILLEEGNKNQILEKVTYDKKLHNAKLSIAYFSKHSYEKEYAQLIKVLRD
jgi:hypothetical protein